MTDYKKYFIENKNDKTDVTPLFEDGKIFERLIEDMRTLIDFDYDKIAGIDSLGFVLGGAIAVKEGKGFAAIRKHRKIPGNRKSVFEQECIDYTNSSKKLEIRKGSVRKGEKILIVDDWIETGGQIGAACELIKKSGGNVSGILAINIDINEKTKSLLDKYNCKAVCFDK